MDSPILIEITHWIKKLVHELHSKEALLEQYQATIKQQQDFIKQQQDTIKQQEATIKHQRDTIALSSSNNTLNNLRLEGMRVVNGILTKQIEIKSKNKKRQKSTVSLSDLLQTAPQRIQTN